MGCTGAGLAAVFKWNTLLSPPGEPGRYPTEPRTLSAFLAPCGAQPMLDQIRFAPNTRSILKSRLPCRASTEARIPMLKQNRSAGCTAWHNQRLSLYTRFTAARRNLLG